ncbi:J domain-containing protein [Synechococcus sp. ATX 2A4]|uniref:J domain-containing protein n=1 Tax=Synechococcus sp. ATX 2A4 TaxID=2823727 RepID=UPI0020CB97E3|nr:J domain-containing protein [Synechococcus sp. ATX 2A4]
MPGISERELSTALNAATDHWVNLYGTTANEAVLEAAMVWLGQDIWPQSDQAEGRPFTWSALEHWILECAPSWPAGPPSFERVMVAAGLLEDPFSTATLCIRLPTLIRRFVHRFRRRRQGTSFQTLEHTMTLQGALKVLEIPFVAGERLTLKRIREAYREQAQLHHPDSGGSADTMRRLNEAYQLLKELYRKSA